MRILISVIPNRDLGRLLQEKTRAGEEQDALLKIEDLHTVYYTYEGEVKAVNGLSLEIKKGDVYGLVGETGCGKTVTALSILRLIKYPGVITKGRILFNDQDLVQKSEEEMRQIRGKRITMIFQEPMTSLNAVYTVGNQVSDVIRLHQDEKKESAERMARDLFDLVRISDPMTVYKKYPHELSGGLRQRVMIAMAIACRPELIIADEPTTALDVITQAEILNLLKKIVKELKTSLLIITHDLGVVAQMCNKVTVMYAGNIVEDGDVESIFRKPMHPYSKGLMRAIPSPGSTKDTVLAMIPGTVPSLISPPPGCKFHPRCEYVMEMCRTYDPALVKVDTNHTVSCFLYSKEARGG